MAVYIKISLHITYVNTYAKYSRVYSLNCLDRHTIASVKASLWFPLVRAFFQVCLLSRYLYLPSAAGPSTAEISVCIIN